VRATKVPGAPALARWPRPGELLPTVVQDARDGTVLLLAYSSPESWRELRRSGELVLYSRSRARLWRKGATSGNTARVVAAALDCDADALLVKVLPSGPICHTGTRSCFGERLPLEDRQLPPVLLQLEELVASRARSAPRGSYTRRLLEDEAHRLKKIGEEASELIVAAARHDPAEMRWEAADLLYHTTVALAAAGGGWADALAELGERARKGRRAPKGRTDRARATRTSSGR
jgi:phosphoribosyl-AMP cyclohydrolase / phosphoribosyl-ATP pyrophosphohydrolase